MLFHNRSGEMRSFFLLFTLLFCSCNFFNNIEKNNIFIHTSGYLTVKVELQNTVNDSTLVVLSITNISPNDIYLPIDYIMQGLNENKFYFDNGTLIGQLPLEENFIACSDISAVNPSIIYEIKISKIEPGETVNFNYFLPKEKTSLEYSFVIMYNTPAIEAQIIRDEGENYITTNSAFWTAGFQCLNTTFTVIQGCY